jgi:hypothetical protein
MGKDSFFIRAKAVMPAAAFVEQEIDLGSFVNLGVSKSTILRIHAIEVQIADASDPEKGPYLDDGTLNVGWDLCTQQQTTLVPLSDKSVIASGRYMISENVRVLFDSVGKDMMPQTWTNGYLVAVDTLYLNVDADDSSSAGDYNVCIVMECTLETATQATSTALALSQQ